ncbi:hypothetical protein Taro_030257, partial [Colocasia esculenta]|nr:hypothetical protein [Colocasia esculenta]
VEHMLNDRLMQFINVDLRDVKDSRQRFDKAQFAYDQARERFVSLKKGTRDDVVAELEEGLQNAKSTFERCRFNFVNALANIEAKKKYEFMESVSAVMDAHMRYYKQGYELLSQLEPFIHQVLTYSQQTKEMTNIEQDKLAKRIQEFRTREQLDSLRSSAHTEASANGDGIHFVGTGSYKTIEALMQSAANGEVQTIKQGYLLKQSSNPKGVWMRQFFVLDTHGTLYYYRNKSSKQMGSQYQQSTGLHEGGSGVFSRFRFSQHRTLSQGEDTLCCRTIDLRTSTIKINAELTDLRFCFRIISPARTYTLQAENDTDRMDWVDKIMAVIASLLNSPLPQQPALRLMDSAGATSINGPSQISPSTHTSDIVLHGYNGGHSTVPVVLRSIPGNDICAECGTTEPDWASLNLGILLCIECSGVHRNLGVHVSKVRSLTFDVKAWEPTILDMFRALGNSYCNSVWEERLQSQLQRKDELDLSFTSINKPEPRDPISRKEKFIQLKYVEKLLVAKERDVSVVSQYPAHIWEAVKRSDIQAVYRLLVVSNGNVNTRYDEVYSDDLCHDVDMKLNSDSVMEKELNDPVICKKIMDSGEPASCMQGCSLLHLACHIGDLVMLELLLQFGADINLQDYHGRTPLHHCIFKRNAVFAKYLLRRGAYPSIKDSGGQNALERAMELGPVTDEELLPWSDRIHTTKNKKNIKRSFFSAFRCLRFVLLEVNTWQDF